MVKNARDAGADDLTPSVPQYFSWINSTNEGSTEKQTLINLEYFRYMKDTYGMQIRIYAWDAGNFDGSSQGYGDTESEKFRSQYPEGYKNIVAKAKESGIRLGLWGSPDGYGDDPETEKKRFDFFVHLCKDYDFGEFKLDGVCGPLRPEKAPVFAKMLQECRKYSPDLIVLNHRLPMYEAEPYVTTFLWQGAESYTDVCCSYSNNTAMHNRSYMFTRGHVDGLARMTEDHGVCISSSIDYFEDEMIYQAFSRSLILAPELYGNPWLLKDSEQPRLARIYTMHARNAALLVHGVRLDDSLGAFPVSRGNSSKRFITTGNNSWETKRITVDVNESIGISEKGSYRVILRHPYDVLVATVPFGSSFSIDMLPFRAYLIEVAREDCASPVIPGMAYEVIREDESGNPLEYRTVYDGVTDIREKAPVYLGTLDEITEDPENGEFLYERAAYSVSNDALEYQSLLRAGETNVPEIKAARDAFFGQRTYQIRGCENRSMFDGREDTFFDAQSRCYCDMDLRISGGCLRIDAGEIMDADTLEIISFAPDEPTREVRPLLTPEYCTYSANLSEWNTSEKALISDVCEYSQDVARFSVHTIYSCKGRKVRFLYRINGKARYFRIDRPMDRIYSVKFFRNGVEQTMSEPFANNMLAPYSEAKTCFVKSISVILPEYRDGSRIALAVNGKHGSNGVYSVLECDGKWIGCDYRSTAFPVNNWEHCVFSPDANNTLFMKLPKDLAGRKVTLYAVFNKSEPSDTDCRAYLCDRHD